MLTNAMRKWDEQQRLKRMSKKIAEAKSVLKKEKIIGPSAPGGLHRKACKTPMSAGSDASERSSVGGALSAYASPYGGLGGPVQRKTKQKPAWDNGHVDYTVQSCYPVRQYTPQKRVREPVMHRALAKPAPAKVPATRKGVKKALIKGLDKIEAIAKQATGSPKKAHRDVAKDLEELHALRENLCGQKSEEGEEGAREGVGGEASEGDLRKSIRDLSSLLDTKLSRLMEETECEVNLGSPQRTHRARHLDDDDEVVIGIDADTEERAAEGGAGYKVGREEGGDQQDLEGEFQAGEEMERDEDEEGDAGDDRDGYADDDFDDDDAAPSGDEEEEEGGLQISQEVMDELKDAQAKIHKLALMVSPEAALRSPNKSPKKSASSSSQQSSAHQATATSPYLGGGEQSRGSGRGAGGDASARAESESNVEGQSGEGMAIDDAAASPEAPPAVVLPVKAISSKPFSFKMKLGGGGAGGAVSQKQLEINNNNNQPLFCTGFTSLNSQATSVKQRIALQEQQHQALHNTPQTGSLYTSAAVEDNKGANVTAHAAGSARSSQDGRGDAVMGNDPARVSRGNNEEGSLEPAGDIPASIAEAGRSESGIVCDGVAAISVSAAPASRGANSGGPLSSPGEQQTGPSTASADARPRRGARSMLGLLGTPAATPQAAPTQQAAESSPPVDAAPQRLGSASGRASRPLLSQVSRAGSASEFGEGAGGMRSSAQGVAAQPAASAISSGSGAGVYSGFSINNPTSSMSSGGASSPPITSDAHSSTSPNTEGRSRPPTQGGDAGEAVMSGADTERKGGRKRINAADIKRAMLAGKAVSPDGSQGGPAAIDEKPNTTLDVGAVHGYEPSGMSDRSGSARSGRGPFRANAGAARFSAAGSLFEQAKSEQKSVNQEDGGRKPIAAAPDRQMGGGWTQSLADNVDVEGSLDVTAL